MKIVYFPRDVDGPGCYRCLYPAAQLITHGGHQAVLGPHRILEETEIFLAIDWLLDGNSLEADIVVISMPVLPPFIDLVKKLRKRGVKVIIDLDDDFLNLPDWNPAKKATCTRNKKGEPNRRVLVWCLEHADAVTVSTPALRDSTATVTSAPIYVLRNFLDWNVWRHQTPVCDEKPWDNFRVGYLGSAPWHSGDLQVLTPWFSEWLKDHPDVEFVAAGDPKVLELLDVPLEQRLYTEGFAFRHQGVARYAATMDVGLVPLQKHPFNEAKSHLKGMEYAGAGVPCLASPTESYRDWWLAGGTSDAGYLCDRPEEWIRALDSLYGDPELRKRMGRAARRLASENTYQQHWRLWENTYNEVLSCLSVAA